MLHRVTLSLLVSVLLLGANLSAQTTSTLSAETGNNTSAANSFGGQSNGNAAAGNVSKIATRSMLYPGATTKVYAHLLPWFCTAGSRPDCSCGTGSDGVYRCNGHIPTGYTSSDTAEVKRQVDDMISRGIDGMIIDWYGPNKVLENDATIAVRNEAQTRSGFEFAIMEDKGAFQNASDKAGQIISDLNYAATNFYSSAAYMRKDGRPVVLFFGIEAYTLDWNRIRAGVQGNPLFIFENANGFTRAQSDGGFSWVSPSESPTSYLDYYYGKALDPNWNDVAGSEKQVFGSGFLGFDDTLATWTQHRIEAQACGQTWLESMGRVNANFSSSSPLGNLQLVTWNDYDEGTELESGVNNCTSVAASVASGTLSWTLSGTGQDNTIDRYRVWSSPATDGQNLTLRKEILGGTARSVAVSALGLPAGNYTLYVQAVGKPSVHNQMSNGVSSTGGGTCTSAGSVTVTSPANGATVGSPIHVVANESSCRTATDMQIYLDGSLVFDQANVESIDTTVTAAAGSRQVAVKAWYADGTTALTTETVTVTATAPVSITAPANGATIQSKVHVTATENTSQAATSMQIYLDSTLVYTQYNTDSIDTYIDANCGSHQITVKAWYADGTNNPTALSFTVNRSNIVSTPTNGATVSSPVHVVSTSCSDHPVTSTQIYLDNVLKTQTSTSSLDQSIAIPSGAHCIVGKGWDSAGNSFLTTDICFTVQ
jgi:hypothetical protein